jgi:hypothetical protein
MANDITLKIGVDSDGADKGLQEIIQKSSEAAQEASQSFASVFGSQLQNALSDDPIAKSMQKSGNAIQASKKDMQSFIDEQKKALVAMKLSGNEGSDAYQKIEKAIKDAKEEIDKIDNAAKEVDASLSSAFDGEKVGGFAGAIESLKTGMNDAFSGGLIGGLVGGGLAQGIQAGLGAIADGFGAVISGGRELISAQANLQAATGASGEEFEALKVSAEDAFIGGVGESLAEATKAIANAKLALKDALPNEEIGTFVKNAQALGTLYDKDVNEVVSKSAPFIRQFGLDGEKAFNLIAFASKEGKTSQDDVLDTLAEYSQLLSEAGFSAEEFAGQMAVAGEQGLFNTDKIADSIKEAQIRLKAGDTAKAITDLQASLPKALGSTFKELESLASSGQISIKEFLQRSGGAIEDAFNAGDISDAMRSQLQVAIAGTPAEDLGAEAYARMFGAPIPEEQIAAKAAQAGREAQNAAGQYLTFDTFTRNMEMQFQKVSAVIVKAMSDAFQFIAPLLNFVANNLGTIASVVGVAAAAFGAYQLVVTASTLATAAYAAVQTALGGTISLATIATYAYNLAMSLNPVGAVLAGVIALVAGVAALTDAMSVSTEEIADQAQANVELIESQKKTNEENQVIVKGTKSMADEFVRLSEKKKLSAAETARLKSLQGDLAKQYPDLVKNSKSFGENLNGVKQIANQTGTQLNNLAKESAQLDKSLALANRNLAFAQRNVAISEAEAVFTGFWKKITFDGAADAAAKQVKVFADTLYNAKSEGEITDAVLKVQGSLKGLNISAQDQSKALGFINEAASKARASLKSLEVEEKAATNTIKDNTTNTNTNNKAKTESEKATNKQLKAVLELFEAEEKQSAQLKQNALDASENGEISKQTTLELLELEKQRLQTLLDANGNYVDQSQNQRGNIVNLAKVTVDANQVVKSSIKGTAEEQEKAAEVYEKLRKKLVEVSAQIRKTGGQFSLEQFKSELEKLKGDADSLRKAVPEKLTTEYAFKLSQEDYAAEIQKVQNDLLKLNEDFNAKLLDADDKQKIEITKQLEENKKTEEKLTRDYANIKERVEIGRIQDASKRALEISLFDLRLKFEKEKEANEGNLIAIEELETTYLQERAKLQEEYDRQNNVMYGIQSAFQMAMMEQFNISRLSEERRANQALRDEKKASLDAEESDLEKSLADRTITFEEYQQKLSELNQARIDAGLIQEKLGENLLRDLKIGGEKAVAQIFTDQGNKLNVLAQERINKQVALDAKSADAKKKFDDLQNKVGTEEYIKAQKAYEKAQQDAADNDEMVYGFRESVLEEFGAKAAIQFAQLAASGTANLADFGKATVQLAFEALQKMIPIYIANIAGKEFATGIGGIATTAILTAALYGLFAAAQSAAGFKDGVVELQGEGTETSDSIPAWLSKGESVITARATKENKTELEWMNRTGLPLREFYRHQMSQTSVNESGDIIHELRQLRVTTESLGVQINRNTRVQVDGVLQADGNSITAMIESNRKRNSRRF